MTDQGNMLRAYGRNVIDLVNQCDEVNTFIPALAYNFSRKPTEIEVEHEERAAGESKYSLYSLIRLNFDLVTGFSLVPLQMFSMLGMMLSLASALLVLMLLVRRFLLGAEAEGVFTLFAIAFFLMGVILFGIGLLGEYVGRIYQQVRARPRYVVQTILQHVPGKDEPIDRAGRKAPGEPMMASARRRLRLPQRRRALPEGAAGRRRRGRAGGHPRRQPGENIWFDSVIALCRAEGIPCITPANAEPPELLAPCGGRSPTSCSASTTATCCRPPAGAGAGLQHARLAAAASTAAARRSTGRCCTAPPKPAPPCTK